MFHMFQVIYAHEWMNDAHDYEMQVQSGKTNTRGVTEFYLERFLMRQHCTKQLLLIIIFI